MKKLGFTLAEVLITLAIIGVVAAMTVPALMTSTKGKEFEVGSKKALSTLANSITMRQALEGTAFQNYQSGLGQFLAVAPGTRPDEQPVLTTRNATICGTPNDDPNTPPATKECSVILKDGMVVAFSATIGTGCSSSLTHKEAVDAGCLITVDTNGIKGPTRTDPERYKSAKTLYALVPTGESGVAIPADGSQGGAITSNANPDIIQFVVRDSIVEAADQRTRNILATGDASKQQ